jgi:hypothetical protein
MLQRTNPKTLCYIDNIEDFFFEEVKMKERTTIILRGDLPVGKRIQEVKKRITHWALGLDEPFDEGSDVFRLVRIVRIGKEHAYTYAIERGMFGRKSKS